MLAEEASESNLLFDEVLDVCGWRKDSLSSFLSDHVCEFVDWDHLLGLSYLDGWKKEDVLRLWSGAYASSHKNEINLLLLSLVSLVDDNVSLFLNVIRLFPRLLTKEVFHQEAGPRRKTRLCRDDRTEAVWIVANEEDLPFPGETIRLIDLIEGIMVGDVQRIGSRRVNPTRLLSHVREGLLASQAVRMLS